MNESGYHDKVNDLSSKLSHLLNPLPVEIRDEMFQIIVDWANAAKEHGIAQGMNSLISKMGYKEGYVDGYKQGINSMKETIK